MTECFIECFKENLDRWEHGCLGGGVHERAERAEWAE